MVALLLIFLFVLLSLLVNRVNSLLTSSTRRSVLTPKRILSRFSDKLTSRFDARQLLVAQGRVKEGLTVLYNSNM